MELTGSRQRSWFSILQAATALTPAPFFQRPLPNRRGLYEGFYRDTQQSVSHLCQQSSRTSVPARPSSPSDFCSSRASLSLKIVVHSHIPLSLSPFAVSRALWHVFAFFVFRRIQSSAESLARTAPTPTAHSTRIQIPSSLRRHGLCTAARRFEPRRYGGGGRLPRMLGTVEFQLQATGREAAYRARVWARAA